MPYNNPEKLVAKLAKAIRVHNMHEKYKANFNTINNNGISSISNLGLQGSQQPENKGFVLFAHTRVTMARPFTRYPEFSARGNEDIEQHWYLYEAIWRACQMLDYVKSKKN